MSRKTLNSKLFKILYSAYGSSAGTREDVLNNMSTEELSYNDAMEAAEYIKENKDDINLRELKMRLYEAAVEELDDHNLKEEIVKQRARLGDLSLKLESKVGSKVAHVLEQFGKKNSNMNVDDIKKLIDTRLEF